MELACRNGWYLGSRPSPPIILFDRISPSQANTFRSKPLLFLRNCFGIAFFSRVFPHPFSDPDPFRFQGLRISLSFASQPFPIPFKTGFFPGVGVAFVGPYSTLLLKIRPGNWIDQRG